jgi:catechol 2,3-dioxygenase-like lactoylglutathione lyase family enzyme
MDLNQVTLPVSDMAAAVRFYLRLGFTQIVDTPHYARFCCPVGNSTFSLSLEEGREVRPVGPAKFNAACPLGSAPQPKGQIKGARPTVTSPSTILSGRPMRR